MKLAVIIFNSQNRKNYFLQDMDVLIKGLNERNYVTIVRATLSATDVIDFISGLEQVDLLVGAGGDGTINEIVNAVSNNESIDPEILFYPTGTVNDYATSLLLENNIESGLKLIDDGMCKRLDSARIDKHLYFNYVCAFGPFTSASYQVSHTMKRELGPFAYVLKGISDVPKLWNPLHVKATVDGRVIEGDFNFGMIVNSHSVAGIKQFFKYADLTDGHYTLFLLDKAKLNILPKLLVGGIGEEYISRELVCISFKELEIEVEGEATWTLDGERGPKGKLSIDVVPENIQMYTRL